MHPFKQLPIIRVGLDYSHLKNVKPSNAAHQIQKEKTVVLFLDADDGLVCDLDLFIGAKKTKKVLAKEYVTFHDENEIEELFEKSYPSRDFDPQKTYAIVRVGFYEIRFFIQTQSGSLKPIGTHFPLDLVEMRHGLEKLLGHLKIGEGLVFGFSRDYGLIYGRSINVFKDKDFELGLSGICLAELVAVHSHLSQ